MDNLQRRGAAWLVVLALLMAGPAAVFAQVTDSIAGTKHNFSVLSGRSVGVTLPGGFVDYGEICVYCHTPHGGDVSVPLWNRQTPSTAGYQMYTSPTIDMVIDPAPSGVSLACLSCHDGTIGIDVITNPPNTFAGSVPNPGTTEGDLSGQPGYNPYADFSDKDLRNDHPVSVTYDNVADPAFRAVSGGKVNGELPLYSGKVQCGSCHNPHEAAPTKRPFLRKSNAASALCLTCHIK